jgi:hypothetical protein
MTHPIVIPEAGLPAGVRLTRPPDPPGEMAINLTVLDGQIVVDFGRAIQWVKLSPEEAVKLAAGLGEAVRTARTIHVVGG